MKLNQQIVEADAGVEQTYLSDVGVAHNNALNRLHDAHLLILLTRGLP